MQPKNILSYLLPRILFILAVMGLLLAYNYRSQIKDFTDSYIEKFRNDFSSSSQSIRRRPLSVLERETKLAMYVGEPFQSFSPEDWGNFWNIIYGTFPKEPSELPFLPRSSRQLTMEEVKQELRSLYPEPFNYFRDEHWESFFGLVLK